MKLSEMFTLLNLYVDDVVASTTATTLFNAGQNKMAAEIKAAFPQLVSTNPDDTFIFHEKYHEIPILYAAAMIKSQDSSIREKGSYLDQFQDGVNSFTENWDVPPRYKDDINVQQFTATAGQTYFTITKDSYTYQYSNIEIYVNDLLVPYQVDEANGISLYTACTAGDLVTATWIVNDSLQRPPYPWFTW